MDKLPAFLGLLLVALPLTFALGAHSPTDDAVSSANVELVLVQVVIRHGARSPYVLFGDEVGIQWNCTAHPAGSFGTSPISSLSPRNRVYAGAYVPDVQVLHGNCAQVCHCVASSVPTDCCLFLSSSNLLRYLLHFTFFLLFPLGHINFFLFESKGRAHITRQ